MTPRHFVLEAGASQLSGITKLELGNENRSSFVFIFGDK